MSIYSERVVSLSGPQNVPRTAGQSVPSTLFGFCRDMYETSGPDFTDSWLAFNGLVSGGFRGRAVNLMRGNSLTTAAGELPDKAWVISAFANIFDLIGSNGMFIQVVSDALILESGDYTTDARAIADSIYDGIAAASATPTVVFQVGNEPYIGASGTHCELNATYVSRVYEVVDAILGDHPTAVFAMPAIGTFQESTVALCKSSLDTNWAEYQSLFAGHGRFTYTTANCYRWDGQAGDTSNAGLVYGVNSLITNAALLGCSPIVTEIGLHNPDAAELANALNSVSRVPPLCVWRLGAGDDFDLIASGAVEVPVTI